MVLQNALGKGQHFRKKQAEVIVRIFHFNDLLKQAKSVVPFAAQMQLLAKDKAVIHEIFAGEPML